MLSENFERKTYAATFKMAERAWLGGIIIFNDAQATIQRHVISPDKPLLVQVEGTEPTADQLQVCAMVWEVLHQHGFAVASFCEALLPHCHDIMAPAKAIPPAA